MRKSLLLFLFLLPLHTSAQEANLDEEMQRLVRAVCLLRGADEATYNRIGAQLTEDQKWTPMNETGALQPQECRPSENIPGFKLNRLLSQIAGKRKYVSSHGDMLNGTDKRYDYSLYERSVRAHETAVYPLKGREGRQWFVLVAFNQNVDLTASVHVDGQEIGRFLPAPQYGSGVCAVFLDTPAMNPDMVLTVSVTGGGESQHFVILNHNSRKP